jgi:L-malate glycosyltransferase
MTDRPIVFMWENFGPMHVDRCIAVAKRFEGSRRVIGIELGGRSDTYDWSPGSSSSFVKLTLFPKATVADISAAKIFLKLLKACIAIGAADFFFCRYERPETLIVSIILRLLGRRVFTMNDSKFDDKPRELKRELVKLLFYLPYNGALIAGRRSAEYLQFFHFPKGRIAYNYDTISIARIREQPGLVPAPGGANFDSRYFAVVARMVAKKNLFVLLEAFSLYARSVAAPRKLHLCGSGPLEQQLKNRAAELGISDLTVFHGFLEASSVNRILAEAVALLLVSTEEQFGLVIPEAFAMGVPVIVSANCGACDELVRSGINGFVVEPDNPRGMAYFMELLGSDSSLWKTLASAAAERALLADVSRFALACDELTQS